MNRALICLTLILGLLACTGTLAQPPGPSPSSKSQMYEDIEVMGRILDRALHLPRHSTVQVPITVPNFGGFSGGGRGFQGVQIGIGGGQGNSDNLGGGLNGPGGGQIGFGGGQGFGGGFGGLDGGGFNTTRMVPVPVPSYPKAQGTYIKGHGVVYTILLPPPKHEPKPVPPLPQGQSEWDRVRKQIRGENPTSPAPLPPVKEPSVTDLVLEALAKNGHHFTQLGDQESLTVSIIFRAEEAAHAGRISLGGPTPGAGGKGSGEKSSEKKKPRAGSGGNPAPDQGSSDYELLGDLHLKQGQGVEALRAYQQALAKSSDAQHAAAMYLKMAQLYLTIQKDEAEAQHALERARELLAQAPANPAPLAEKSGPKPTAVASPLPARLIITAHKRLLDQVGSGKMSLEEFKKAASVEHLSFGAAQK